MARNADESGKFIIEIYKEIISAGVNCSVGTVVVAYVYGGKAALNTNRLSVREAGNAEKALDVSIAGPDIHFLVMSDATPGCPVFAGKSFSISFKGDEASVANVDGARTSFNDAFGPVKDVHTFDSTKDENGKVHVHCDVVGNHHETNPGSMPRG